MNKLKLATVIAVLMIVTACDQEKNKLDSRAKDFWMHKINRDFDKAYDFLTPGWKSSETKESYVRRMSQSTIKWRSIEIKDKQCSEKYLCSLSLKVEYEYTFKGSMAGTIKVPSEIRETWLMKNNTWYNVQNKSML